MSFIATVVSFLRRLPLPAMAHPRLQMLAYILLVYAIAMVLALPASVDADAVTVTVTYFDMCLASPPIYSLDISSVSSTTSTETSSAQALSTIPITASKTTSIPTYSLISSATFDQQAHEPSISTWSALYSLALPTTTASAAMNANVTTSPSTLNTTTTMTSSELITIAFSYITSTMSITTSSISPGLAGASISNTTSTDTSADAAADAGTWRLDSSVDITTSIPPNTALSTDASAAYTTFQTQPRTTNSAACIYPMPGATGC